MQRGKFAKLDGRGEVARRLRTIRADLIDALGGDAAITPQQMLLIEGIAQRAVRCEMIWRQMMTAPEGVATETERRWNWHRSGLERALAQLGLQRRAPPAPSLAEVLTEGKAA